MNERSLGDLDLRSKRKPSPIQLGGIGSMFVLGSTTLYYLHGCVIKKSDHINPTYVNVAREACFTDMSV